MTQPNEPNQASTILVADDDYAIREAIVTLFELKGYTVIGASHGASALKIIDEQPIDLLITDISMPYLSGVDLVRTLRQRRQLIPVIAISGGMPDTSSQDGLSLVRKMGVNTTFQKPVDLFVLADAAAKLLAHPVTAWFNTKKVVMVSDTPLNQALRRALSDNGHTLIQPNQIQDVDEILTNETPDIVVSDCDPTCASRLLAAMQKRSSTAHVIQHNQHCSRELFHNPELQRFLHDDIVSEESSN